MASSDETARLPEVVIQPLPAPVATLQEVRGPNGRTWQLVTTCAGLADHFWLERDRLLALSDGAAAVEIVYEAAPGQGIRRTYAPSLPAAAEPAHPLPR